MKLARRLASISELEENLEALFTRLGQLTEEIKTHGQMGRLTGPLMRLYSDYQNRLRQDIKKTEELLILSRREEAKERLALTRAVMARQVIEKTKDRQKEAFDQEAERGERETLEEMAGLARTRRLKETGVGDDAN